MDKLDRLVELLTEQHLLQKRLGLDPVLMDGDRRADMLVKYAWGVTHELAEAMDHVDWKPWTTNDERLVHEDEAFGELRDAWQLLTNMMFLVYQVSPEELADRFEKSLRSKLVINHRRVEQGYTGRDKCSSCRVALDEYWPLISAKTELQCANCGYQWKVTEDEIQRWMRRSDNLEAAEDATWD